MLTICFLLLSHVGASGGESRVGRRVPNKSQIIAELGILKVDGMRVTGV